jgi:hypothetical protein
VLRPLGLQLAGRQEGVVRLMAQRAEFHCDWCGSGSDEDPPEHTQDCERPDRPAAVCLICGAEKPRDPHDDSPTVFLHCVRTCEKRKRKKR